MTMCIVHQALDLEMDGRLRQQIAAGLPAPGAWIEQAALTATLGISRALPPRRRARAGAR